MRIDDKNWMDIEDYLKNDDRLILVVGACEQHGYLSLLTDIRISQAIAEAASQKTGVLIAPPLNFGISPYFLSYPGSISLRTSTFIAVIQDLVRSVYAQGFKRLLVLNGHGGNAAGRSRLVELVNELPGLKVCWYEWWIAENVTKAAESHGLKSYHAAWIENFPFTRVADVPEGAKTPVKSPGILGSQETRQVFGDGVYGGPYQVDDRIMKEILDTAVKDTVELLKFW